MTITLLINRERVEVDNSLLRGSKLVEGILSDLKSESIDIIVPSEYSSVIYLYLYFTHKISYDEKGQVTYPKSLPVISDADTLFSCFFMEAFFADDAFFSYLMKQAYGIWSEFYPDIKLLPDERLVYLYTPYELVPKKYMDKESFFREWLSINANEDITLNGNRVYHTDVKYYPNKQIEKLDVYLTINGEKVGFSHEETWYANGQPQYRTNYKDGEEDGLQKGWYENGQLQYRHIYKDDEEDGLWEGWYANGQPQYRTNYKDGEEDGLWEGWYANGQPQYRTNYKDGEEDGLWEGWYANGQPKYVQEYRMGKLISEENF